MKIILLTLIATIASLQSYAAPTKSLVVYTSRKEHLVKDIFKQYEVSTGVNVKYRTGKAGALIQAIKAEGKNTSADLFMTVDAGNLWFASQQGLLQNIESQTLNKNVPSHLRDTNGSWYGLSVRARTIVYNPKAVKVSELSTYENLADKKWKGKLCLRTSKKVYNQSLVAMLISQNGYEKTKETVKGWVNNVVDIKSNDTSVLKAIASGECSVGIVNTYYYGRLMKKDPSLALKIFWPNQKNSYGVHINVSGAGIVKQSKNKVEAKKFLEWLSSKKAQATFAQVNMEYAISKSSPQAKEVLKWGTFKRNNEFNLTLAGKLQKRAIKLMQEVGYR